MDLSSKMAPLFSS